MSSLFMSNTDLNSALDVGVGPALDPVFGNASPSQPDTLLARELSEEAMLSNATVLGEERVGEMIASELAEFEARDPKKSSIQEVGGSALQGGGLAGLFYENNPWEPLAPTLPDPNSCEAPLVISTVLFPPEVPLGLTQRERDKPVLRRPKAAKSGYPSGNENSDNPWQDHDGIGSPDVSEG